MAERRNYTEQDKAVALAYLDAMGGNVSDAAKKTKIPRVTLQRWRNGEGLTPDVPPKVGQVKKALADLLEEKVRLLVGSVDETVCAGSSLGQIATAAGIFADKMQLLRAEPTSITQNVLSDTERAERLAAIYERARQARDGRASVSGAAPNLPARLEDQDEGEGRRPLLA